ncbi:HU family DNA-binding protein [uncultured Spirosoma sp.]|jgi:DNA-binding protein HU-beta|uniref:HU family DNA-binding protein n=1 Tax=uncultured Spirosoma sp. TaxID=278208 RepID=UPI00263398D1|nr:HU family DNA-binding protein [uncultured Spirosoma sp.]MBR8840591.1 integration host factor subunit beta [Stigonema ocellatum SAG 48.90 = DSM 106950]
MTKQDVINQVSEKTGLDMLTSRSIIESFFEVVKDALTEGEPIYIRTFGSFIVKQRASKVARNISQNTAVRVAAHVIPSFKASRAFANQVRAQEVTGEKKKGEN